MHRRGLWDTNGSGAVHKLIALLYLWGMSLVFFFLHSDCCGLSQFVSHGKAIPQWHPLWWAYYGLSEAETMLQQCFMLSAALFEHSKRASRQNLPVTAHFCPGETCLFLHMTCQWFTTLGATNWINCNTPFLWTVLALGSRAVAQASFYACGSS